MALVPEVAGLRGYYHARRLGAARGALRGAAAYGLQGRLALSRALADPGQC